MTGSPPGSPGRCRAASCWASICWVKVRTKAGTLSNLPIDPEPNPDGNVARRDPGDLFVVLGGADLAAARVAGRELWMPHHASCPARARGGVATKIRGRDTTRD